MNNNLVHVSTVENFREIESDWNDLLSLNHTDNIFLTHDWLLDWWIIFGQENDLWILVWFDNTKLIGIAPLYRYKSEEGVWTISFLGSGLLHPNHLDFICKSIDRENFVASVCEYLWYRRNEWDILDLAGLIGNSLTLKYLTNKFDKHGMRWLLRPHVICPYAELPETYDNYLETRDNAAVGQLKSKRRRLMKKHPEASFGQVKNQVEAASVFNNLVRLHQLRWQELGFPGSYADERVIRFHHKVIQNAFKNGSLRLYYIRIEKENVAVYYCYRIGSRVMFYSTGFDKRWQKFSVGTQLLVYAIEQSILEGAIEFDFLQGNASYKSVWATHKRENLQLLVASPHIRGSYWWVKFRMNELLRNVAKRIIPTPLKEFIKKIVA